MSDYKEFLKCKERIALPVGFECDDLNPMLKPIQQQVVRFNLRVGRSTTAADTGQGKTPIQLVWAEKMNRFTNKPILIMTPLAVASQTLGEADKFHIGCDRHVCREAKDIKDGINIINIERMHKLEGIDFGAVVIDESSCLKSIDGKYKNMILERFSKTPYRLACTATPAPNDQMELGNHAEYCGWSSRSEMLSTYFTHDGGETSKWRLRGHAKNDFYRWLASWMVMYRKPSDLGFSDDGYELPPLTIKEHVVATPAGNGLLFSVEAKTLGEQRQARRDTIQSRVNILQKLTDNCEPWVVWCNLNDESTAAHKAISGSLEVRGSQSIDEKEENLSAFSGGQCRVMVSKPDICGFGLNWQHCHNIAFLGISHSYEQYYQAIRRCWRYGQTKPVNVHIIVSDRDSCILENIHRKEQEHNSMLEGMIAATADIQKENLQIKKVNRTVYQATKKLHLPKFITEDEGVLCQLS